MTYSTQNTTHGPRSGDLRAALEADIDNTVARLRFEQTSDMLDPYGRDRTEVDGLMDELDALREALRDLEG